MTNKEEIAAVADALRKLADSIDAALGEKAGPEEKTAEDKAVAKTTEQEEKKETGQAEMEEEKAVEPKYTLADVRKVLAAKSGAGYTDDVRELLKRHGASRLSAVDESDYPALMKEAEEIGSTQ